MGNSVYAFYSNANITGTITDVIMGNVSKGFNSGTNFSEGDITGTITNIIMGDVDYAFFSTGEINSTISNIIMGNVANYSFYVDNFFSVLGGDISGTISYVKSNGPIYTENSLSVDPYEGSFKAKLINCEFDCRGKATVVINKVGSSSIIERCKLLSDSSPTISAPGSTNVYILYTIINNGNTNITIQPVTNNYNLSTW
jgi:hypothetical protein